jgi:flagellin
MGADLARIATNIPAMQNINTLGEISNTIAKHQWRLATGKRINSPEEDPAGYLLARGLESRRRGLSTALDNVSNAQNILDVGAGGYESIMDKLQTLKEKATQAADGSLSSTQRAAIDGQRSALITEIDAIVTSTTFNGSSLIDGTYSATSFQVGEQSTETMSVNLGDADSAALSINSISLSTAASASAAMTTIDSAIDTLADRQKDVGEYQLRLQSKEANLKTAVTKTEAVRSTIEDADFAKEQMEVMKLQILQQTSLSSLSQANSAPQLVLSLFR